MHATPLIWALRIVVVSLLGAVLLQPLNDHHIGERIPGHVHIHPVGAAGSFSHLHLCQVAHHHADGVSLPSAPEDAARVIQVVGWRDGGSSPVSGGGNSGPALREFTPMLAAYSLTVVLALPDLRPYCAVSITPLDPPPISA